MSDDVHSALQSITKGAGLVFAGTVVQLGLAFLAKVVMARFLELNEYGFVSLGIIAINFGATLALVGLETGIARYIPRYENQATKRSTIYFAYVVSLSLAALLALGLYVYAGTIASVVFKDPRMTPVLRVMAVGIPFWALLDLGIGVTRGLSETVPRIVAKNFVLPLGRFVFVSIAVVLGTAGVGVAGAYVASYIVASVLITYLVTKRFLPTVPSIGREAKNLLAFSVPLTFSNLSSLLYGNIDLVLIGILLSASDVAIYNVVYPLARLLLSGMGAFGFLFLPVVSSLHADGKLSEAKRVYQITTKWLLLLVTPPFALMALFPEMSIKLMFGAKYVDGALALTVLAIGFFLSNVTGSTSGVLTSIGRSRIVMATDVSSVVLNVGLNLVLIPRYGFLGAAIATAVTYLGRDLTNAVAIYHLTGIHPFTRSLLRPTVFTGIAVTAVYVPVVLFLRVTLLRLVGLFVFFMVLYIVAIFRLGGIEEEDVMLFNTIEDHTSLDLGIVKGTVHRLMGQ